MARQQGRQSGRRHHREGLCREMPRRDGRRATGAGRDDRQTSRRADNRCEAHENRESLRRRVARQQGRQSGRRRHAKIVCRAGTAAAQPAPTAAPAAPPPSRTTTTTPPPATSRPSQPAATAPSTPPAPAATRTPAAGQPAGANQYATEAQAKARCPSDTVVWANLDSKIYHYSTNRNYGQTKSGAYMCEKDTAAAGIRAAKNEKRP